MHSPEVIQPNSERGTEVASAAGERLKQLEALEKNSEKTGEKSKEALESAARHETEAAFSRETGKEAKRGGEPTAVSVPHASKRQRTASYTSTMKQIQSEMGTPARTFSKLIHNRSIEKASDIIGSSAARPNAVLAGSIAATFLTLFVFVIAKQYGYRLSGFETIGTFFVGWALGLIYDYARLMFISRRT